MSVRTLTMAGMALVAGGALTCHRSSSDPPDEVTPESWTLSAPSAPPRPSQSVVDAPPSPSPSPTPSAYGVVNWGCSQGPTGSCPQNDRICLYGRIPGYADDCPDCDQNENDCWYEEECSKDAGPILHDPRCLRTPCPKKASAVAGSSCTVEAASCWYDGDLRCRCSGGSWSCAKVVCPTTEPPLGSACARPWERCLYSVRCAVGTNFERYRVCRKGVWEEGTYSCAAE